MDGRPSTAPGATCAPPTPSRPASDAPVDRSQASPTAISSADQASGRPAGSAMSASPPTDVGGPPRRTPSVTRRGSRSASRVAQAASGVLGVVGGVGQGGALTPAVGDGSGAVAAHQVDEDQGAAFVGADGRGHGLPEGKFHPQQVRVVEAQPTVGPEAAPEAPVGPGGRREGARAWAEPTVRRPSPCAWAPSVAGSVGPDATPPARVAERQTRWTQNPLSERVCGFDSRPGHARSRYPTAGKARSTPVPSSRCRWESVVLVVRAQPHAPGGEAAPEEEPGSALEPRSRSGR